MYGDVMATGYEGPLEEYRSLRQEIDARSRNQHQILSFQLTTVGGIFAFVITKTEFHQLLVIVPVTSYLLCGRFVTQVYAVLAAARYIRRHLSQQVPGGLSWEKWQRYYRRRDYSLAWFLPLSLTFPGAGLLAVGVSIGYVALDKSSFRVWAAMGVAWVIGLAASVGSFLLLHGVRKRLPDQPSPRRLKLARWKPLRIVGLRRRRA